MNSAYSRNYHHDGILPPNNGRIIFVFGSNQAGRHGTGAAKAALLNFGAKFGTGEGQTGNAYAIPTKDHKLSTRRLPEIKVSVSRFIEYAMTMPSFKFFITRIGCGLSGYEDEDIAPMFVDAPENCILPEEWISFFETPAIVAQHRRNSR